MAELFNTVLSSNAIHANKNIIGAGPVGIRGSGTPQNLVVGSYTAQTAT